MVMDKRLALQICIAMWDWIAEHPEVRWLSAKTEAIAALNLPDDMVNDCAACECDWQVRRQMGGNRCSHCPVWTEGRRCHEKGELYNLWFGGNGRGIGDSSFAKGIADLARERLKELDHV